MHFLSSISMLFKNLIISSKTDYAWTGTTLFLVKVDIAHLIPQWSFSKIKSLKNLTRKRGTLFKYCWDWTWSVIKHDKCNKDFLRFSRRFSFNLINVPLSLPRNSNSWSFSMLRVLEQAFVVGHDVGDDVVAWLDGTPGHIEDEFFGRYFPLTFISSKCDGQCNRRNYRIFTYS